MNEYDLQSWYMEVMDNHPLDVPRDLMSWYSESSDLDQDTVGVSICHVLHKLAIMYKDKAVHIRIVKALREIGQNKVVNRHKAFNDLIVHMITTHKK